MKITQHTIGAIGICVGLLIAVVLNYAILSQVGGGIHRGWIVFVVVCPLMALIVSLSLRRSNAFRPSRQSAPPSVGFWIVTAAIGCVLAASGGFIGNSWLMMGGIMFAPIAASLRGQFSLRRMFGIMTLLAVCMGIITATEQWRVNALRENEQRRVQVNRKIKRDALEQKRADLESRRDRLPPKFYEEQQKLLDLEAAELQQTGTVEPQP